MSWSNNCWAWRELSKSSWNFNVDILRHSLPFSSWNVPNFQKSVQIQISEISKLIRLRIFIYLGCCWIRRKQFVKYDLVMNNIEKVPFKKFSLYKISSTTSNQNINSALSCTFSISIKMLLKGLKSDNQIPVLLN